jgi:hypothetical protein
MSSIAQSTDIATEDDTLPGIIYVTPAEGLRIFDEAARTWTGMSGEEFIQRWESGEFAEIPDDLAHRRYVDLILMMPLARQDDEK